MASLSNTEEPPTYIDGGNNAADAILPPATLYVAGRFIHSSDPHAPPLYEFSHSIGFLRESDHSVRLERLDYTVKTLNGTPHVSTRKRHIYDLKHPTFGELSTYAYHAEATSRGALCGFAIESFRLKRFSSARGYRVMRTARGPPPQRCLMPRETLFTATPARDRAHSAVTHEWTDAQGRMIAREVDEDQLLRLVVGVEMGARLRDLLVTAWILRLWWELADGNHQGNIWDDAKRILGKKNPELAGYTRQA
ncbi:hypothetical protein HJFPF1_05447 [Paramyrothecium foliicola]|nr:hypothetical protein HJFPF1_05447 [Paramyrothecium foliicola]